MPTNKGEGASAREMLEAVVLVSCALGNGLPCTALRCAALVLQESDRGGGPDGLWLFSTDCRGFVHLFLTD